MEVTMKKKLALILLFIFICMNALPALATEINTENFESLYISMLISELDISNEINKAQNGLIDENVPDDVIASIIAGSADESVEVVYTVTKLGTLSGNTSTQSTNNEDRTLYAVTASTVKGTRGDATEDNVECWVTIYWIDNWGMENEIVEVDGGWISNGRTLSHRQVHYGVVDLKGAFLDGLSEFHNPTEDEFRYFPSKQLIGLSLRAYTWVESAGYSGSIYCGVWPTVLD